MILQIIKQGAKQTRGTKTCHGFTCIYIYIFYTLKRQIWTKTFSWFIVYKLFAFKTFTPIIKILHLLFITQGWKNVWIRFLSANSPSHFLTHSKCFCTVWSTVFKKYHQKELRNSEQSFICKNCLEFTSHNRELVPHLYFSRDQYQMCRFTGA